MDRWDQLNTYLYDGVLEIDNNLIENAIRPLALGRKNYLFAGSHSAAQRGAIMYSFFAIWTYYICLDIEIRAYWLFKLLLKNEKRKKKLLCRI